MLLFGKWRHHAHTNHLVRKELAAVPQTVAQSSSARQARASELIAKGLADDNAALAVSPTLARLNGPFSASGTAPTTRALRSLASCLCSIETSVCACI